MTDHWFQTFPVWSQHEKWTILLLDNLQWQLCYDSDQRICVKSVSVLALIKTRHRNFQQLMSDLILAISTMPPRIEKST
jgi:hypothetical protein